MAFPPASRPRRFRVRCRFDLRGGRVRPIGRDFSSVCFSAPVKTPGSNFAPSVMNRCRTYSPAPALTCLTSPRFHPLDQLLRVLRVRPVRELAIHRARHRSSVFLQVVEVHEVEELHQLRAPEVDVVDALQEIQDDLLHFLFREFWPFVAHGQSDPARACRQTLNVGNPRPASFINAFAAFVDELPQTACFGFAQGATRSAKERSLVARRFGVFVPVAQLEREGAVSFLIDISIRLRRGQFFLIDISIRLMSCFYISTLGCVRPQFQLTRVAAPMFSRPASQAPVTLVCCLTTVASAIFPRSLGQSSQLLRPDCRAVPTRWQSSLPRFPLVMAFCDRSPAVGPRWRFRAFQPFQTALRGIASDPSTSPAPMPSTSFIDGSTRLFSAARPSQHLR